MTTSKLLVALVLLLAVTGTMGQTDPAAQKVIAACGIPVSLRLLSLSPQCMSAIKTAKKCPAPCLSVKSVVKTSKCAAAALAATPKNLHPSLAKVNNFPVFTAANLHIFATGSRCMITDIPFVLSPPTDLRDDCNSRLNAILC